MSSPAPTWFITGASSGLGRALAEAVLARGWRAAMTARRPETLADLTAEHGDRALALALDVTDSNSIAGAVHDAETHFGVIDVLVNNAGYGAVGSLEDLPIEDIEQLMRTNFLGAVNACQMVLPLMREQGHGKIILVSSIGARIATPGAAVYYASKAAVSALAESLAMEVGPFNIQVTAVEPGGMKTRFAEPASLKVATYDPAYEGMVGATIAMMRSAEYAAALSDPRGHAGLVLKISELDEPPVRILAGADAFAYGTQFDDMKNKSDIHWEELSKSATLA